MVHEHEILFRIQNFQQGGRGVAAEIHAHFLHFIQHEHRVPGPCFLHHLENLSGKRADVGAPVAADLRLIANAPQRESHKLTAGGAGNGHPERGFPHSGRADEAENGAFRLFDQAAHRQKLKNSLLDLFQAVVILRENLFGPFHIFDLFGLLFPGNRQQPIEIVAGHGGFGRHGRHHFQPLQLLRSFFLRFLGHSSRFDLFLQFIDFALLAPAQLLLDRLHLLVQVVLFLGAFHLPLDAALDVAVHV